LARLAAEDRSSWSGSARSARLVELAEVVERAQAELVRCAAAWDAVGAWEEDGALSATSWLATRTPVTRPAAARLVRTARFVYVHIATATALAEHDVSVAHVEVLAAAAKDRRDLYERDQSTLLSGAAALVPDDLAVVARRWRSLAGRRASGALRPRRGGTGAASGRRTTRVRRRGGTRGAAGPLRGPRPRTTHAGRVTGAASGRDQSR